MNKNIEVNGARDRRKSFVGRWLRSSGRVVERGTIQWKQHPNDLNERDLSMDLVKIYHRFLELKNDESADLAEAVAYGLRLLESSKKKSEDRDAPTLHKAN